MSEPVTLDVRDGVAHVRLRRPDRGNAIDLATARGLLAAATACQQHRVRAVVLRGAGRSFCVGGDLREFASFEGDALARHLVEVTGALHAALRAFAALDAPLVAAVHGAVAGAGVGLAAAADLTIAADDATFVCAYTGIGYTPDAGVTWTLPRLVGPKRALDLLLTNRRLGAREAAEIGLVSRVVALSLLDGEVERVAAALATGATAAFGATRRLVAAGLSADLDAHLDREAEALAAAAISPEGRAGVAAFLNRRKE
ncbi:enoyl-CoA hydratase/isomerase family protein [Phytohabitans rumicis]|uniref:Enoyl-CoA hydratase n=1 Tax=Phytohabitans rumicis TaxID=1076125 RepID=A0A6V8KVZ3_9ACTN|nr:enoyl-CoA hydratase/isomerase family protein [Phytohabitans rumicis]GFJ86479.1 enoyl-CoA hydratase [Phytohabitans rumicis]